MPNIKTLLSSGAQAASWLVTEPSIGVDFDSTDWAQLPDGKLKQLLTTVYTSPGNLFSALSEAGIAATTIGSDFIGNADQTDIVFEVDGSVGPVLGVLLFGGSNPDASLVLTLSTVYSVEA